MKFTWYDKIRSLLMDTNPVTNPNVTKVLIVEDESSIAELYTHVLEKEGIYVKTVGDPVNVLQVLQAENFNIMFLDLMMPRVNGLEILKSPIIQQKKSTMKIVVLTNLEQENIIKQAYELGASGYVIKAKLAPQQLVDVVKNTLNPPADQNSKHVEGWFSKILSPFRK